ncbi:MAG: BamA/TamA family outer membrane protein [Rikenellaceae bacterium]
MRKLTPYIACAITLLLLFTTNILHSQETHKEVVDIVKVAEIIDNKTEEKENKNLRFSILGGPGYTPDYGFLVGGSALMTFDLPGMKGFERRSVMPVAFSLSFSNGVNFSMLVRPQLFMKKDHIRLTGEFIYSNLASNYYGVGYNKNKETERGAETTQYFNSQININPILLFRLGESDWFLGPTFHLQNDKITDPSLGMTLNDDYIRVGGTQSGFQTLNSALGFSVNYDSRDVPANAYSGIYFDVKGLVYGGYLGGDFAYQQLQIKYRQYTQLSKNKVGRTLAWSVYSDNIFGDAPFTRLSTVGSPFDLRGYYQGQYRDNSAHVAMVEYRHKFQMDPVNFWSKVGNRLGFTVWMGSGLLGPSPFEIEGVLPNYGAGLRIEMQPRMNFRVDVGYSPIEKQTLVYLNMTEAF